MTCLTQWCVLFFFPFLISCWGCQRRRSVHKPFCVLWTCQCLESLFLPGQQICTSFVFMLLFRSVTQSSNLTKQFVTAFKRSDLLKELIGIKGWWVWRTHYSRREGSLPLMGLMLQQCPHNLPINVSGPSGQWISPLPSLWEKCALVKKVQSY